MFAKSSKDNDDITSFQVHDKVQVILEMSEPPFGSHLHLKVDDARVFTCNVTSDNADKIKNYIRDLHQTKTTELFMNLLKGCELNRFTSKVEEAVNHVSSNLNSYR